ncbi:alpha/beta-hydrolase family protein [Candidatus Saccharibacteria bacterium]|jgi:uncharacterized membrane protein|nr:alpha/beta-hydrolase family protein [Candidatus Saccharibacteria bacterium]MBP7834815.1 alpha/beta-hydrolase family protein [Candidatus Saccharibacteria bacterium]
MKTSKKTISQAGGHKIMKLNFGGIVFGLAFFCLSLLPSLLPRPWLYQGLISGASIAIGYGLGTAFSWLFRWLTEYEFPKDVKQFAWKALAITGPISVVIYLYLGAIWQNNVRELVGESPIDGRHMIRIALISTIFFILLLLISRGIKLFTAYLIKQLDKFMPRRLSNTIGLLAIIALFVWLTSGVFYTNFVDQANKIYSAKNKTTPAGVSQPTSPYRSGSIESLIAWDTLGYQGQNFVAKGPSQQQLEQFTGNKPKEQIRIYSGLNSASNASQRANLALQELKRTGAFDRKVLILATATGTGWLEPQSVDSIEYMYGGDSAIVTQQYSYLPSWISFLVDNDNATQAGQELYNAVYGEWNNLPKDKRPKLIAYGLSLGSFGGQSAYSGISDLRNSIDGALFMGTPSTTQLWSNVTANRDTGSPEWQPTYQQGNAVRFAATNENINSNQSNWKFPRVLYMQHASDPVVWFNFDLLFNKPDWLNEKRGPDVSPTMRWYPFITFLQVTVDQFFGVNVPNGHGHNYPNTIVDAWGAVVPPTNWNTQKANELQNIINTYSNE